MSRSVRPQGASIVHSTTSTASPSSASAYGREGTETTIFAMRPMVREVSRRPRHRRRASDGVRDVHGVRDGRGALRSSSAPACRTSSVRSGGRRRHRRRHRRRRSAAASPAASECASCVWADWGRSGRAPACAAWRASARAAAEPAEVGRVAAMPLEAASPGARERRRPDRRTRSAARRSAFGQGIACFPPACARLSGPRLRRPPPSRSKWAATRNPSLPEGAAARRRASA